MPQDSGIPPLQKGDGILPAFNDLVASHNDLRRAYAADYVHANGPGGGKIVEEFLGKIAKKGPKGEDDYTDERYWVDRIDVEDNDVTLFGSATAFPFDNPTVTATNLAELNPTDPGQHALSADTIVHVFATYDNASPPNRRYFFNLAVPALIPVALTSDGGANGDKTTAPTYTYTVRKVSGGGDPLATTASPQVARPKGKVTAASYGLGYYASGSFTLLVAFEVPGSGACP